MRVGAQRQSTEGAISWREPREALADGYRQVHREACKVLGIDPGHGSVGKVAKLFGVNRGWYGSAQVAGRCGSLESLCDLASQLGFSVLVRRSGAIELVED